MNEIDITPEHPFTTKDFTVAKLYCVGLSFREFSQASKAAGRAKTDMEARRLRFREQLKMQLRAKLADGKQVRLDDEAIAQIPAKYATRIRDAMTLSLFPESAGEAKVVSEGDGYSQPILIALGQPLKMAGGVEFAELEFKAGTLADLEDILSLDNSFDQTEALLGLAQPASGKVLRLPDSAKDQLSIADGLFLMRKVLPLFADAPTSS